MLLGALEAEDAALPLEDGPDGVAHRHEPREGLHGNVECEVGRDYHGPLGDVLLKVDAVVRVPEAQPNPVLTRLKIAPGGQQVEVPRFLALWKSVTTSRARLSPAFRSQLQQDLPNPVLEHGLLRLEAVAGILVQARQGVELVPDAHVGTLEVGRHPRHVVGENRLRDVVQEIPLAALSDAPGPCERLLLAGDVLPYPLDQVEVHAPRDGHPQV